MSSANISTPLAPMRHSQSTDILFPEDENQHLNDSFYSSTPSNADTFSSYSNEVKYMFETQYQRSDSTQKQYYSSPGGRYSNNSNSLLSHASTPKQYSPSYEHAKQYSKKYSPYLSTVSDNNNVSTTPLSSAAVSHSSRNFSSSASSTVSGSSTEENHNSAVPNSVHSTKQSGLNNNNNNTRRAVTHRDHLNRSLDSFPNVLSSVDTSNKRPPPPPYIEDIYAATKPIIKNGGPMSKGSVSSSALYPTTTPKGPPPPYPGHRVNNNNQQQNSQQQPPPPQRQQFEQLRQQFQQQQQHSTPPFRRTPFNNNKDTPAAAPKRPGSLITPNSGVGPNNKFHNSAPNSGTNHVLNASFDSDSKLQQIRYRQRRQPLHQPTTPNATTTTSSHDARRKTWSPASFNRLFPSAENKMAEERNGLMKIRRQPLTLRSAYSIEQLDSIMAGTDDELDNNYGDDDGGIPEENGDIMNSENGCIIQEEEGEYIIAGNGVYRDNENRESGAYNCQNNSIKYTHKGEYRVLDDSPIKNKNASKHEDVMDRDDKLEDVVADDARNGAITEDETDFEEENIREDLDHPLQQSSTAPPKIAPVSGRLENSQTAHKSLIRPIAFKPITTPPSSSPSSTAAPQPYGGPHNTTSPPPPPRPSPPQGYSNGGNRNGNSGFHPQQQRAQNSHGRPPHPQHQNSQNSHQSSSQESTPVSGAAPLSKSTYLTDSGQKIIGSSSDSGRADSYNSSSLGRASHNSSGSGGRASGNVGGGSVNGGNGMMDSSFIQTPSPSDSGLGELEAMIRDRDVQIRQLRDTMERNETAILKVCEEKEQNWEMKFREMHGDWEKKLRLQQQTAFKMEQALLMQLFKLQQERKTMKLETESLRSDKESREREVASLREEATSAKTKLEETQWDMCQKVGEISHLKVQLKESKDNLAQKSTDVLSLRAQLKESQRDCGEKNGEILGLESELKLSQEALKDMRKELDHMQAQIKAVENKTKNTGKVQDNNVTTTTTSSDSSPADLQIKKLKEELSKFKTDHEADKDRWLAEKDKVIRYQRHLQLNYVQMANKNKMLEAEVQQLTLELEGRDISLESSKMAGEPEESMC